ncbi:MAG: hypothetical protein BGO98_30340 [Myxococcales bacterium 68-20]|nr:MAG: hypothetical protein BGO98_30340 [Myxococcales bacterium 68-20]
MKLRRTVLAFSLVGCAILALAQGCQDPTQVTLELSLDKKARCQEIGSGTAITVGVEPADTETRLATGFVTARTSQCDDPTGRIGTLVVTPGESSSRASVVVVAGYKGKDPATCMPPLYEGCIVARRRFAFSEHTRLRMPIVIDPDCAGVPCDAFSTCSNGLCFDSETRCSGSDCETPGVLEDGGVDEASRVEPEPDAAGPTEPVDASDAGPSSTYCSATGLVCNGARCDPARALCCFTSATATTCEPSCAESDRVCCTTTDCKPGFDCIRANGAPFGRCTPADAGVDAGTEPYCDSNGVIHCGAVTCGAGTICCGAPGGAVCVSPVMGCPGGPKYCCTSLDCTLQGNTSTCLHAVTPVPDPPAPADASAPAKAGICSN